MDCEVASTLTQYGSDSGNVSNEHGQSQIVRKNQMGNGRPMSMVPIPVLPLSEINAAMTGIIQPLRTVTDRLPDRNQLTDTVISNDTISTVNTNNVGPELKASLSPTHFLRSSSSSTARVKRNSLAPETDIECAVCSEVLPDRSSLISHSKVVHDKTCGFCGKRFSRNANLKEHIRIHTGYTPFVCSYCQRGFKQQHRFDSNEQRLLRRLLSD